MNDGNANTDIVILRAHAAHDNKTLAEIYYKAAMACENEDVHNYCFLLTNAYVCALEAGLDISKDIHANLVAQGREI